jgi:hypothetical protein
VTAELVRPSGTTDTTRQGREYRFTRLTTRLILADARFSWGDPMPGDPIPAFDLPLLDGRRFQSRDLAQGGPALIVFGSSTCPMTDSAMPGLHQLHVRFGHAVRFVLVAVREAHAGTALEQPTSLTDKVERACHLRVIHGVPFDVAVDDADGTFHRRLGPKPASAYLVGRDGWIHSSALTGRTTRTRSRSRWRPW